MSRGSRGWHTASTLIFLHTFFLCCCLFFLYIAQWSTHSDRSVCKEISTGFKEKEFSVWESRLTAGRIQYPVCLLCRFWPSLSGLLLTLNPQKKPPSPHRRSVLCPVSSWPLWAGWCGHCTSHKLLNSQAASGSALDLCISFSLLFCLLIFHLSQFRACCEAGTHIKCPTQRYHVLCWRLPQITFSFL